MECNARCFWIEPKVEFVARIVHVFRVVGAWVYAATHHHKLFRQRGKLRIVKDCRADVSHRTCGIDSDLVRMLMHHATKNASYILAVRPNCRCTLEKSWDKIRSMRRAGYCPRSLITHLAV